MDVNRKLTVILVLVVINLCVSGVTGASQIHHLRWSTDNFRLSGQFQSSVSQYRQANEKLQNERWENLMQRLDTMEQRLNERKR